MSEQAVICSINYLNGLVKLRSNLGSSAILCSVEWLYRNVYFLTSTVRQPNKFLLGPLNQFHAVNIPEERRSHSHRAGSQKYSIKFICDRNSVVDLVYSFLTGLYKLTVMN
jgi:hypothetical protein